LLKTLGACLAPPKQRLRVGWAGANKYPRF
jgi:hypothetical protein